MDGRFPHMSLQNRSPYLRHCSLLARQHAALLMGAVVLSTQANWLLGGSELSVLWNYSKKKH